jgi:5-carboxyvanillate decarboxylase
LYGHSTPCPAQNLGVVFASRRQFDRAANVTLQKRKSRPTKKPLYLRIASEEAFAPPELLREWRKMLDRGGNLDPGFVDQWSYFLGSSPRAAAIAARITDIGEGRIRDMDATGIARQILSLTNPGVQLFEPDEAASWAISCNDQLAEAIKRNPDRFSGLASISPQNPPAASKELERAIGKLGLKGAIINSHTKGEYLDDPKFWDIFAAAESLDVPIYLHPSTPSPRMYAPFAEWGLEGAIYGFAVETSLHLLRIIVSGVFDRFPKLRMVVGHLGEGLPFWFFRLDFFHRANVASGRYPKVKKLKKNNLSDYLRENIWITTSGMAWEPAILYCQKVLGVDRVLYAMDYPYQFVPEEVKVTDNLPIPAAAKKRFYQTNAEKVFNL